MPEYKPFGGHKPNYDDRGPSVVAAGAIFISVPTIAVCIRFWSRKVATRSKFWWDDGALLVTLAFSNAYNATMIWWTTVGYGRHMYMLPMSSVKKNMLGVQLITTFYIGSINFIKISTLLLYARLFRVSVRMTYTLWTLGGIVICWWIASEVLPWFACNPPKKTLDPFIPGVCVSRIKYYHALGLINPLLDITILLLPMPILWKLRMSLRRKLLAASVFVLGYCSVSCALIRSGMIFHNPKILSASNGADPTWDTVPLQIVSMLEAPLAIIALSGPPINQIMRRAKTFGWHSLFSTARTPPTRSRSSTKSGSLDSANSQGSHGEGGKPSSMFHKIVRKKGSSASMPERGRWREDEEALHPVPSLGINGQELQPWDGGKGAIQVQREVLVS